MTRFSVFCPTTKPPASWTCSLAKAIADVLRGDVERGHSRRQQVDPDGAVAAPAEAYFADAVDGFQAFLDDVERILVELLLGAVALQRQPHDRHGVGLHLGDDGRVGVLGQAAQHLVDLGLHLVEGDVDFLVQAEGDVDDRDAGRGGGLDVLDAGHAVDRRFDHVGDAGIDDVGIGALQRGGDRDDGKFDMGKAVHADALVADDAEQHQHRRQHERQHMALDGKFGQGHLAARAFLPFASFTLTAALSVRKPAPSTPPFHRP